MAVAAAPGTGRCWRFRGRPFQWSPSDSLLSLLLCSPPIACVSLINHNRPVRRPTCLFSRPRWLPIKNCCLSAWLSGLATKQTDRQRLIYTCLLFLVIYSLIWCSQFTSPIQLGGCSSWLLPISQLKQNSPSDTHIMNEICPPLFAPLASNHIALPLFVLCKLVSTRCAFHKVVVAKIKMNEHQLAPAKQFN